LNSNSGNVLCVVQRSSRNDPKSITDCREAKEAVKRPTICSGYAQPAIERRV
jgi:hypothetical protein